jgi:hypothetical protein
MADKSGKNVSRKYCHGSHPNLEYEIRRLAFEIYVDHVREDAHDLYDCLLAAAEILGSRVKAAALHVLSLSRGLATRGALTVSQRQVRVRVVPLVTAT